MSFKYRTTTMQVSPLEHDDVCIFKLSKKIFTAVMRYIIFWGPRGWFIGWTPR